MPGVGDRRRRGGLAAAQRCLDSVAFNYAKNHVYTLLNALAGLRFHLIAWRLTSGPNFLFQRCDALLQVFHRLTLIASSKGS